MLTADKKDRITGEPSGEPETLWGKIQPGAFGDRVHRSKPAELEDRMKKAKERARDKRKGGMDQDDLDAYAAKRKKAAVGASVLTADADGSYRPKTRETRSAYEALLGMIQGSFGDQPQDVLRGAAEEVLEVLKEERSTDPERKTKVEALMGPTDSETFAKYVALGKLVTDFAPGGGGGDGGGDGGAPETRSTTTSASPSSSRKKKTRTRPTSSTKSSKRATSTTRTRTAKAAASRPREAPASEASTSISARTTSITTS